MTSTYNYVAAHFLLEVYEESGAVYCYIILRTVKCCSFAGDISFLWDTAIVLKLDRTDIAS